MASYEKIRSIALSTLFQYNGGNIPLYAEKNFVTHFSCNRNEERIEFENDADFTEVLEQAAEDNLLDENDNMILEIYCRFTNNFHKNDNMKNIRKQASEAANNALKKLKRWIQNASTALHKPVEDMDYIVVSDTNKSFGDKKEEIDKFWASRVVRFLAFRDLGKEETESKFNGANEQVFLIENVFDGVISFANEFFTEICYRNGDFLGQVMDRRRRRKANLNISRTFSLDEIKMMPDKSMEIENREEIMFHPADEQAPDEWKIFFSDAVEKDTVFVCKSDEDDTGDAIFVRRPDLNDVKSVDSDNDSEFENLDEPGLKNDDQNSDGGSSVSSCENWEML
jgi:hypothetical protein